MSYSVVVIVFPCRYLVNRDLPYTLQFAQQPSPSLSTRLQYGIVHLALPFDVTANCEDSADDAANVAGGKFRFKFLSIRNYYLYFTGTSPNSSKSGQPMTKA